MGRLLVATLLLISSSGLWAQTTDLQSSSSENSKTIGFLELSFPTSTVATSIDSDFGSETSVQKSSPFSLGANWGLQDNNNRGYIGLSFEKLDAITVNGDEKSKWNLGFKLSYDRCFKPWITDFYLTAAFLYYPVQGERFISNGNEFSPKGGLGIEGSLGWISPWDVAFNFGYKSVMKQYSYEYNDPIIGRRDEKRSSIGYGWVFVTASIGRF